MTNEEIYKQADHATELVDLATGNEFDPDTYHRVQKVLLDLSASLVSQAYEEAAMKAFDYHASIRDRENPKFEGVDTAAKRRGGLTASDDIGKSIRALKDSLQPEAASVSSSS